MLIEGFCPLSKQEISHPDYNDDDDGHPGGAAKLTDDDEETDEDNDEEDIDEDSDDSLPPPLPPRIGRCGPLPPVDACSPHLSLGRNGTAAGNGSLLSEKYNSVVDDADSRYAAL